MKKILLLIFTINCVLFNLNAQIVVKGISPAAVEKHFDFDWAKDWGQNPNFNNAGVYVQDTLVMVETGEPGLNDLGQPISQEGCISLSNASAVNGKIAVIRRGTCYISEKAMIAQNAGAVGVIIINYDESVRGLWGGTPQAANVTIPVVMVDISQGQEIIDAMATMPVVMFLGNKLGLNTNDLGSVDKCVLLPEFYGTSTLLSQNANELDLKMGLKIFNFGTTTQSDVIVNATLFNPSGIELYSENINSVTVNAAVGNVPGSVLIHPNTSLSFPPLTGGGFPEGEYTLTYFFAVSGVPDEDPFDNMISVKFVVNNSIISYSRLDENLKPKSTVFTRAVAQGEWSQCLPFRHPNASRIGVEGVYFQGVSYADVNPILEGVEFPIIAYKWNDPFLDMDDALFNMSDLDVIGEGFYTFGSNQEGTPVLGLFDEQLMLEDNQRYLFCVSGNSYDHFLGFDYDIKYNQNIETIKQPVIVLNSTSGWFIGFNNTDRCPPALGIKIFDANEASIKETTTIHGKAYPNPANDIVTIDVQNNGNATLKVTDVSGRTVLNEVINVESGKSQVNISTLESGMYVFNVVFENGKEAQFSVVKK